MTDIRRRRDITNDGYSFITNDGYMWRQDITNDGY